MDSLRVRWNDGFESFLKFAYAALSCSTLPSRKRI